MNRFFNPEIAWVLFGVLMFATAPYIARVSYLSDKWLFGFTEEVLQRTRTFSMHAFRIVGAVVVLAKLAEFVGI